MSASITAYQIQLEKRVYLAGEAVNGTMTLTTSAPIECRGVRIRMDGVAHSRFYTGSGDNRELRTHTKHYARSTMTVWGKLFKTPVIDGAGSDVFFGPPWKPDEGVIRIAVGPQERNLILRVMDYDWGKKDDLLGEVLLDVLQLTEEGVGKTTIPLTRKGSAEKGNVTLSAEWDEQVVENVEEAKDAAGGDGFGGYDTTPFKYLMQPAARLLKVTIHSAMGLRSGDMFSKNDVYCQLYSPPEAVVPGQALPPPVKTSVLPAGTLQIPFTFQLPPHLPSSAEVCYGNYVRYSVYSFIDIKWRLDPSTRATFTVLQNLPSALPALYSPPALVEPQVKQVHQRFPCIPCCCCSLPLPCISYGQALLQAQTDRTGYAPGEVVHLFLRARHNVPGARAHLKVAMQRRCRQYAEGRHSSTFADMPIVSLDSGARLEWYPDASDTAEGGEPLHTSFVMPSLSPSFLGELPSESTAWLPPEASAGGDGNAKYRQMRWGSTRRDPLVWTYSLVITFKIPDGCISFYSTDLTVTIPLVVAALPLSFISLAAASAIPPTIAAAVASDPPSDAPSGEVKVAEVAVDVPVATLANGDVPGFGGVPTALPVDLTYQTAEGLNATCGQVHTEAHEDIHAFGDTQFVTNYLVSATPAQEQQPSAQYQPSF